MPCWALYDVNATVQFHGADGERQLIPVLPEHPTPLCLRKFEQPPFYARCPRNDSGRGCVDSGLAPDAGGC